MKEAGLVEEFLEPNNHKDIHNYLTFSMPDDDPPDAIVYTQNNKKLRHPSRFQKSRWVSSGFYISIK